MKREMNKTATRSKNNSPKKFTFEKIALNLINANSYKTFAVKFMVPAKHVVLDLIKLCGSNKTPS